MTHILTSRQNSLGLITLHRPAALNAQDLQMVRDFNAALDGFEQDGSIKHVLVQGAGGKAFCAGGDIRAAATRPAVEAAQFFREEYRLVGRIAGFPKPVISLVDGICMGGGMGIAVHSRYCIVTENAVMAMPEMKIGLFPDIGAAYFLARAPGAFGIWLALTGARLSAGDAGYARLASGCLPSAQIPSFIDLIVAGNPVPDLPCPASPLAAHQAEIDEAFSAPAVEEIVSRLERMETPWAEAQLFALQSGSPTSQKVTLQHMWRSRGQDLRAVLTRDYRIASACLRGPDFREGVRALVIDKDKTPRWNPPSLEDVTPGLVARHFSPPIGPELYAGN